MAVAAYATLRSLSHVLDNLQLPARLRRLHADTNRIQSLQETVQFLLDFLEAHSRRISEEIGVVGRQIADAAAEAEEVVDRHVVDQLRFRSEEESHCMAALSSFSQDIDKVTGKLDSLVKELTKMVKEEWAVDAQEEQCIVSLPVKSPKVLPSSGKKTTVVGFDEHVERIVDKLTRGEPDLQILAIVGMGGIGKTTLAQNVFDHPYNVHYFPKRIWLTISQEYSVPEILSSLLHNGKKQETSKTAAELGQRLYQSLFGERYLIVMDDIWSVEAWNDLKLFFPNNGKGSRVMLTTRESSLAISLGSQESYSLDFLNEEKSWNLFCQETFAQKDCPYSELEEIGKNIAKSCNGLPLTIVVLGGLLANSNMTREYWESVAKDVSIFRNSKDYEGCLKILFLSYNNLPVHLKPCFLYMSVFPEDSRIRVSKLTKLWIAEGFLKPIRGKSLREVAEKYLRDLIDRNLFLSFEFGFGGKIKQCGIHDLLRDLCLREYEKEHFIYAPKVQYVDVSYMKEMEDWCFICHGGTQLQRIDLNEVHDASQLTSLASVLVCNTCKNKYSRLNKARVVRARLVDKLGHFAEQETLHPTSLRDLEMCIDYEFSFPSTIALLWNQMIFSLTICVHFRTEILPYVMWGMPQLRECRSLDCDFVLPEEATAQDFVIMENLHTLSSLRNFRCTEEVLRRIPNLKKLLIGYDKGNEIEWTYYCLYNLVRLQKLESLSIEAYKLPLENLTFPTSLKKLHLERCNIPWEKMMSVGSLLPNLEKLVLELNYFEEQEWNQVEGDFPRLKFLKISCNYELKRWRAENIHFPNLEILFLERMWCLQEIPAILGDIPTLHSIYLKLCTDSVIDLAKQIVEEQYSYGNEILQLYINEKRYQVGSS
ncbi:putative late blight resistance protein homolog R1A-10 [Sesamum indicum]|uniref:Late blight resistance protein homolog R1A-10 n=1 Tax=Sesamum indicum TaxID=4182 RepID=A0A6I9SX32_SESIN|nr:putative late blight resistance protein homolog R1A-10 [Sesamum indicum]